MLKLKLQCFGHLVHSGLIGKDPDAGKDSGKEEQEVTEDEMVGWHHKLNASRLLIRASRLPSGDL